MITEYRLQALQSAVKNMDRAIGDYLIAMTMDSANDEALKTIQTEMGVIIHYMQLMQIPPIEVRQ